MIEHRLVRAAIIPQIVRILCRYCNIAEDEALKRFYESATGANFADDENGLYGQSALHIAGLFIVEQDGAIDSPPAYKMRTGRHILTGSL